MRYFLCSLLLLTTLPLGADAERLYTSGFEWNTITAGHDWLTNNGTSMSTSTTARSGTYSIRLNTSAATSNIRIRYRSADSVPAFARAYIRVTSYPSAQATIMRFTDLAFAAGASIRMNTDGTLELWNADTAQVGSDSSALSLDTWYRIEWSHETGATSARIDGTEFASGSITHSNGNNMQYIQLGTHSNVTMDIRYDDVAVNDSSGAAQTSFPGAGNIVMVLPTGDGDGNCSSGAGDWANINEVPPSDTATAGGTNICELDVNPTTADFAATDSSTAGIDSYDTITLIQLWGRVREETSGATNYTYRIKSASGGTTSVSASGDSGNATPATNPTGTTAFARQLVSYTDPTTGIAWTPTGTNSIDNMQIGAGTTDGSPDTWITTLAAYVEYVDGSAPPAGGQGEEYTIIFGYVVPMPKDIFVVLREILFV